MTRFALLLTSVLHDLMSHKARSNSARAEWDRQMQTEKIDPPKLAYSIKEACRASSLGRTTVYAHIAANRLKAIRIGGRTVIPVESLQALLSGEA